MRLSIPYYHSTVALLAARGFAARCSVSRFTFTLANSARHGFYKSPRNRLLGVPTKPYTDLSGTEQFKIRLIQTEKEFESIIINAMVKEGWGPGLQDAECFMACDPTAGFVGELNGIPICCATTAKYTHVQYTRSVTGRKRGDGSRRIVTDCRVVTTRHESLPTVSTVTPEVMSRKGIAEVNFR